MSTPLVFCRVCGSSLPLHSTSSKFCCNASQKAFHEEANTAQRIRVPRIDGTSVSWDEAIAHIASKVDTGRKIGLNTFGIYTGKGSFYRGQDWLESMLLAFHTGTTSWFTDLCMDDTSRLLVTEWMIGHAAPLLTDLGRAHNILILGDDPSVHKWGMLQPDHQYTEEIKHSQQTKHTKVSFVSASAFTPHISAQKSISIRPGSEPFFLLGMLNLTVNNGWYDKQYVGKYTLGLQTIKKILAPYTVSRCADLCGISDADISGVTLKWVRSAMGLIHLGPGALRCEHATLGAWAWLTLHALSANALRPGGIYEPMGALDLLPLLIGLRTDNAPKSQTGGQQLILGQNHSSQLLLEMERGNLETLILLDSPHYPQQGRFHKALQTLSCSVVLSDVENDCTAIADVVLPRSTPWEESDILLHRNSQFAIKCLPTSSALHPQFAESKSAHEVLTTLGQKLSFKWTGSEVGLTNRLLAKQIQRGGQETWINRAWGLLHEEDLELGGSLNGEGEHDRALWRPSQDIIQLAPDQLEELFKQVRSQKTDVNFPFFLHSSHARGTTDSTPQIEAHPDCGFKNGSSVTLSTRFGRISGVVVHNESVHPSGIVCSAIDCPEVLDLLPTQTDLWSGTPIFNGVPCLLEG